MKYLASATCGLLSVVFLPSAFAQFGVEDEFETAPASIPAFTPVPAEPAPETITLEQAIATMREYQSAVRNDDVEYFLSILAEPEKSLAEARIRESGLTAYINYEQPLYGWELLCGACWDDPEEGSMCVINDQRETPEKRNTSYYVTQYILRNIDGYTYVTERPGFGGKRGRQVKKMQRSNDRVCGIDEVAPLERSGGLSLFRGIKAVIESVAQ